MKIQIRKNVFETNSSSTHSLTFASDDEYNGWKNGTYIFDTDNQELVLKSSISPDVLERDNWMYKSYDDYFEDYDLDSYDRTYTTNSGEVIHAFGKYGYDS